MFKIPHEECFLAKNKFLRGRKILDQDFFSERDFSEIMERDFSEKRRVALGTRISVDATNNLTFHFRAKFNS